MTYFSPSTHARKYHPVSSKLLWTNYYYKIHGATKFYGKQGDTERFHEPNSGIFMKYRKSLCSQLYSKGSHLNMMNKSNCWKAQNTPRNSYFKTRKESNGSFIFSWFRNRSFRRNCVYELTTVKYISKDWFRKGPGSIFVMWKPWRRGSFREQETIRRCQKERLRSG